MILPSLVISDIKSVCGGAKRTAALLDRAQLHIDCKTNPTISLCLICLMSVNHYLDKLQKQIYHHEIRFVNTHSFTSKRITQQKAISGRQEHYRTYKL